MNIICLAFLFSFSGILLGDVSRSQRNALVSLYKSTNGEHWKQKENWLDGDPCTNDWQHVSCNREHSTGAQWAVLELYLYNNSLSGTLPKNLADLDDLMDLNLGVNSIGGTIPTQFGAFKRLLKSMSLAANRLHGTIPTELGKLTLASRLILSYNSLSGTIPTQLANMKDLDGLDLSVNSLEGTIPSKLKNLNLDYYFMLNDNSLQGFVEDWVCDTGYYSLQNNKFSCPLPACCETGNGWCGECCETCVYHPHRTLVIGVTIATIVVLIVGIGFGVYFWRNRRKEPEIIGSLDYEEEELPQVPHSEEEGGEDEEAKEAEEEVECH